MESSCVCVGFTPRDRQRHILGTAAELADTTMLPSAAFPAPLWRILAGRNAVGGCVSAVPAVSQAANSRLLQYCSICAAVSASAAVLNARLQAWPCCRAPAGAGQAPTAANSIAALSVQATAPGARRLLRHSRLLLYQHSPPLCTAAGPVYIGQAVAEGACEKDCARWGALGESGAAL